MDFSSFRLHTFNNTLVYASGMAQTASKDIINKKSHDIEKYTQAVVYHYCAHNNLIYKKSNYAYVKLYNIYKMARIVLRLEVPDINYIVTPILYG